MDGLNFDFREFFGTNNGRKTQRMIDTTYPRRPRRVESLKPPEFEEYTPQIGAMPDPSNFMPADAEPTRDTGRESKGRAIATGVAALLSLLGRGDVAANSVAAYRGTKLGQDQDFATRLASYQSKQKAGMQQFDAALKQFQERERLRQTGVSIRNSNLQRVAQFQMDQAKAGDAGDYQDASLAQRVEAAANRGRNQMTPQLQLELEQFRNNSRFLSNPTARKASSQEEIARVEREQATLAKKFGVTLEGGAQRLGMTDAEQARSRAEAKRLNLSEQQFDLAKRKFNQTLSEAGLKAENIRSLMADRAWRRRVGDTTVMQIEGRRDEAFKLLGQAENLQAIADGVMDPATNQPFQGPDDPARERYRKMAGVYAERGKDMAVKYGTMADSLTKGSTRSPGLAAAAKKGRAAGKKAAPTIVKTKAGNVTFTPMNTPQDRRSPLEKSGDWVKRWWKNNNPFD